MLIWFVFTPRQEFLCATSLAVLGLPALISERRARIKDRKGMKKMQSQKLDMEGLLVNTTVAAASSLELLFLAFVYFTVPWEAKPKLTETTLKIHTGHCSHPMASLFLPSRLTECSAPPLDPQVHLLLIIPYLSRPVNLPTGFDLP